MGRFLPLLVGIMCFFSAAAALAASPQPTLRVAVDAPYPPFADYNDKGELVGFDVDIAKALCAEMQRDCDIKAVSFNDIIPKIVAGELDMAVAGMGATEERKKFVDFTERYYRSLSIYIEKPGAVKEISPEGLKGKRVGTQAGTLQEAYLKSRYDGIITLVTADSYDDVLDMLKQDKLDLALIDGLPGYTFLKSEKGHGLETVGKPVESNTIRDLACITVSKRQPELRKALNAAIQSIRRSGEYGKINRKYFDFVVY